MTNKYFPDEEIQTNDLYFICYMIERVARRIHQRNKYVVNAIGRESLVHLISVANVLHCENPLQVEDDWIEEYSLVEGPMADDTIWNYVDDFTRGEISRTAFWELVKFKYPTHQIVFCTEEALQTLHYEGSITL